MTTRNRQLTVMIDGEVYYAAQKAQEVLGMTYSALRNQVIAGNVSGRIPKGKRQMYYKMKDVETLARELNVFTIQRAKASTRFEPLKTREEMKKCIEISEALFGVSRDINDLMKTVEKNPETYYVLKDDSEIVGYTAIWPLKHGNLEKILVQTLPVQISKEDIETFEYGKKLDIYVTVIAVKPKSKKKEEHYYGARIISGLISNIIELGARGIDIETIAARSDSSQGIKIIKGLGFTEIEPLTPERRTFIINIKDSGIPFIMQYKKALEESKNNES